MIIAGEGFNCSPGNIIIIPPDTIHCTIADTEIDRWCLHFDWEPGKAVPYIPYEYSDRLNFFMPEKCNLTPEWVPCPLPLIRTAPDYQIFFELLRELFACGDESLETGIRQKGIFLQILSLCLIETSEPKSYMSPVLLKAKEYIDMNFRNPELNVSKVARKSSVTVNHICRIFKKELGISPLEYINSLRLRNAAELLAGSSLNIAQIALETGFRDSNYFSRLFKKKNGVSPSSFVR